MAASSDNTRSRPPTSSMSSSTAATSVQQDLALLRSGLHDIGVNASGRVPAYLAVTVNAIEKPQKIQSLRDVASFPALQRLFLPGNAIDSLAPLAQLKNVSVLDVSDNQLKGVLCPAVAGTDTPLGVPLTVKRLNVSGNQLEGVDSLSLLGRLRVLDVSRNDIKAIDGCLRAPNLEQLSATHCNLQTLLTPNGRKNLVGTAKWLTTLDISHNELTSLDDVVDIVAPHAMLFGALNRALTISRGMSGGGLSVTRFAEGATVDDSSAADDDEKRPTTNQTDRPTSAADPSWYTMRLRKLVASHNRIAELTPSERRLRRFSGLAELDLSYNLISVLEECVPLHFIQTMRHLSLVGNPCDKCVDYRMHVLYICTRIKTLDGQDATAEQRVHAVNLYGADANAEASIRQGYFALELSDYGRSKPARSAALPVAETALAGLEGDATLERADAHVASLADSDVAAAAEIGAAALAQVISGPFKNQVEITRACYTWLTVRLNRSHIDHGDVTIRDTSLPILLPEYEVVEKALMDTRQPSGRAQDILEGKAPESPDNPEGSVPSRSPFTGMWCERASFALMALLNHRGVECRMVSGFSKADHSWLPGASLTVPNGCWLGVCTEGKWRLIDMAGADPEAPDLTFYMSPPHFIFTRLPLLQQMQLLGGAPLVTEDGEPGSGERETSALSLPKPDATVDRIVHTGHEPEVGENPVERTSTMGPTGVLNRDEFWRRAALYPSFFALGMTLVGHNGMVMGDMLCVKEDEVAVVKVQFHEKVMGLQLHVYDVEHALHTGLESSDVSAELHEAGSRWGIPDGSFEPADSYVQPCSNKSLASQNGPWIYDLMVATHKPEQLVVRVTGNVLGAGRKHDIVLLEFLLKVEPDVGKLERQESILNATGPTIPLSESSSRPTTATEASTATTEFSRPATAASAQVVGDLETVPEVVQAEEVPMPAPEEAAEKDDEDDDEDDEEEEEESPAPAPAPAAEEEEPSDEPHAHDVRMLLTKDTLARDSKEFFAKEREETPLQAGKGILDELPHELPRIFRPPSFPRLSPMVTCCDLRLISPLTGELEAEKTFSFEIFFPQASQMLARSGHTTIEFDPPDPLAGKMTFTKEFVCPGKHSFTDCPPPLTIWADVYGPSRGVFPVMTYHVEPAIEAFTITDVPALVEPSELMLKKHKELRKLRKKFNKMDRNSDGEVDHRELLLALRADKSIADILSMPSKVKASDGTRQTFDDVFKSMDKDASGTISWAEFAHALGY